LATVVRSSGRVDRSRRAGRGRAEALVPLVEALTRSAAANLTAAGARAELVLRTHLRGAGAPDGGPSLDAAWSASQDAKARAVSADSSSRGWAASAAAVATESLRQAALEPSHEAVRSRGRHAVRAAKRAAKRAERAERALGEQGIAAVALAAAAGLEPARALLVDLLGDSGTWASDGLRADLADRGAAEVARERAAVGELLDDPDLAPDASSLLRLRLAVLKGLT
ncbi:MAG TPA: hypothetical protein VIK43_02130, partial [Cellulomonas sp.]